MSARDKVEAGLEAWGHTVYTRRWLVIVLMVGLALGLVSRLPHIVIEASPEKFLRDDDPTQIIDRRII